MAHNVSLVESVFALHVSQSARASDWAAQATEIPQKFMFSQLWGVEVQDRVATRVGFWWGLTSWLVDGWLLAVSSRGLSSVCVRRGLSHVLVGQGSNPTTSVNFDYLSKGRVSKYSHAGT